MEITHTKAGPRLTKVANPWVLEQTMHFVVRLLLQAQVLVCANWSPAISVKSENETPIQHPKYPWVDDMTSNKLNIY